VVGEDCRCANETGRRTESLERRMHLEVERRSKVKTPSRHTESDEDGPLDDRIDLKQSHQPISENVLILVLKSSCGQTFAVPADTDIRGQHLFRTSRGASPVARC